MTYKIITALAITALLIAAVLYDQRATPSASNTLPSSLQKTAPNFTFKTLSEQEKQLADFKGKRILLNFWATWCAPCVEEIPLLLEIADKNQEDLVLIMMSVDHAGTNFDAFFTQFPKSTQAKLKNTNVLIGLDPEKKISQAKFGTFQYPESFAITKNMRIEKHFIGSKDLKSFYAP